MSEPQKPKVPEPDDAPIPPLRMAPKQTLDDLIHRAERERRSMRPRQDWEMIGGAPASFRIGSVPYLNAVPLTRGLEDEAQFVPPAQLAEMLRANELDAALVSVVEVLLHDGYDTLDGIGVSSLGEVFSVFLAHTQPLEEITEIYCDPATLTSVNLLKVLLAEKGLKPEFKTLESYAAAPDCPNVLLIGNPAIEFRRLDPAPAHEIWDLGAAWFELAQLPFVYAIWALRQDVEQPEELRAKLREAKEFGIDTLDYIISDRDEYDREFRQDYLGWHIHYHIGSDEKRGLAKFSELLKKHNLGPVYPVNWVA